MANKKNAMSAEGFVKLWQGAKALSDVAKATNRSESSVRTRAAMYRRKGIKLKQFPSMRGMVHALDVERLNKLAASLGPKDAPKSVAAKRSTKRAKSKKSASKKK